MARKARSLKDILLLHELAFIVLVVLAGMAGALGIHHWQQASQESLRINQLIQEIQQTRGDLYRQMKELFDAFFLQDAQARNEYEGYARSIERHFGELEGLAVGAQEQNAIAQLKQGYGDFLKQTTDLLQRHGAMPSDALRRALNTDLESGVFSRYETLSTNAERLLTLKRAELQQKLSHAKQEVIGLMVIPILLACMLLVFSRFFLQRAIARPVADILHATAAISAGQWAHKVPAHRETAELAQLAEAINAMASDLAQSREALVRSEKQATQGALVPMLAHNIRNPLASIRATAQVADEPQLPEETRLALRDIIGAVDRLERWTSAMLAYLHPLKPQPSSAGLQEIVEGALAPLQQKLREKQMRLIWDKSSPDAMLYVDVHLLEQAIYNLLLNAMDASAVGSAVEIAVSLQPTQVEIHILDHGPGMPFTPTPSSLSAGPSTKRFGTGLGIPFAFKVTEAIGGSLLFSGRAGGGACVTITLPLAH